MTEMHFAANLGFLWTDLPLPEAVRAAAHAGFSAVEFHWPYDQDTAAIRAVLLETGLPLLGLNTKRGDIAAGDLGLSALPGRETEARAAIDEAIALAKALGSRAVHVMAGKSSGAAARASFVDNLRYASDVGAREGLGILIEPLNHCDMPGYFLTDPDEAASIIEETGRDNISIMFDCYHMGRSGFDPLATFKRLQGRIGHIQFAAVPDRTEPDHGEIDFSLLLPALCREGYVGWFGAEYRPRSLTGEGLGWLADLRA